MGIQFQPYRKSGPWVVTWRNPWTGKKHTKGFESEALAMSFEKAQAEIANKEKALLRKARRRQAAKNRITVAELLECYFRLALGNPASLRQTRYHAVHLLAAFGRRLASQIS